MRLFAGFPVAPSVEDRLTALRLRLAAPTDGLRWTGPEQWHITLRFFGDVEEQQLASLKEKLQQCRQRQPVLRMDALGLFPAKGILYAAVERTEELQAFHAAFTGCVAPDTQPGISLPFHPHISLARSKGRAGQQTLSKLSTPKLPAFGPALQWSGSQIHLYESALGPRGATYRTVATHALSPG